MTIQTYTVKYDLRANGNPRPYRRLYGLLDVYNAVRVAPSVYEFSSVETIDEIFDAIAAILMEYDTISVMSSNGQARGRNGYYVQVESNA